MSKIQEGIETTGSLLSETYSLIRNNLRQLVKAIGWLLVIGLCIDLSFTLYEMDLPEDLGFKFSELLWVICALIVYVFIAVRTHRVLINSKLYSDEGAKRLTNVQAYMFFIVRMIWLFVIFILGFFPLMLVAFVGDSFISYLPAVVGVALTVVILWYLSRLSLSLPSIAVGINMTLGEAHKKAENHQFLMFLVVVILPTIFMIIPYWLLSTLIESEVFYSLLTTVIDTLVIVFEVALLSVAYIKVTESQHNVEGYELES